MKEDRLHGDVRFPLNVYCNNRIDENNHLQLHWHPELEFLLVRDGAATFRIEERTYSVEKGQFLFVNCGELHGGFLQENHNCLYDAIVFDPHLLFSHRFDGIQENYLDPIFHKTCAIPSFYPSKEPYENRMRTQMEKIIRCALEKQFAFELVVKSCLLDIFAEIFAGGVAVFFKKQPRKTSEKAERIKTILEYLYANYSEKLLIADLAAQFNMSEGHFYRFFHEMTQKSPVAFINHYRICQAARMLSDTDDNISKIALEVGFENIGYFNDVFRKQMKCTPSVYRKDAAENSKI